MLRTSERFPRRLIAERRIRFTRVGRHVRIPESALREFIAAGLVEPVTTTTKKDAVLCRNDDSVGVRKLPSGRYQARYAGPDGTHRAAPQTFATKTDADVWLTMKEAEIHRGDWIDPDAGKILFGTYADTWMHDQVLKPRTDELYRGLLKNHLKPTFGNVDLGKIREGDVRRWRKERINAGQTKARPFGPVTVAKSEECPWPAAEP